MLYLLLVLAWNNHIVVHEYPSMGKCDQARTYYLDEARTSRDETHPKGRWLFAVCVPRPNEDEFDYDPHKLH